MFCDFLLFHDFFTFRDFFFYFFAIFKFFCQNFCICGTQSSHAEHFWTYKNGLSYTFAYGTRHIAFKCKYPDDSTIGLAEPMTIIVVVDIEGVGKLSLELNAFVDNQFQHQALASLEKEDDLFVQIKTHAKTDVSRKVYAEDC